MVNSTFLVPIIIFIIIFFAAIFRVPIYDEFLCGASDSLKSFLKILMPILGLIVSITVFRESGMLEILINFLKPAAKLLKIPNGALPLVILKPISGSGSIAMLTDIFRESGPDSHVGKIASVMMSSTETCVYALSIYFGAVKIKNLRYAMKCAIIADFLGILLSIYLTSWLAKP
jgi:spore maturation protein B